MGTWSQEALNVCSQHVRESHRTAVPQGRKVCSHNRGSLRSGTKVGYLGKGKYPQGYHRICQEPITGTLKGSIPRMSTVLQVIERRNANSQPKPKVERRCENTTSVYSQRFLGDTP